MSLGYRLLPEQAHIYFVPSDRELMGKERVDSIHQCLLVLLMDLERYFSIILLSAAGKFEPFIHSFMVSASKVDRTHYKAIYNHNSKTILLGSRICFTCRAEVGHHHCVGRQQKDVALPRMASKIIGTVMVVVVTSNHSASIQRTGLSFVASFLPRLLYAVSKNTAGDSSAVLGDAPIHWK